MHPTVDQLISFFRDNIELDQAGINLVVSFVGDFCGTEQSTDSFGKVA
jgi:hypothetical protein